MTNHLVELVETLRSRYPFFFHIHNVQPIPPDISPRDRLVGERYWTPSEESYTEDEDHSSQYREEPNVDRKIIEKLYEMGREHESEIMGKIEGRGVEALAWYSPFHYYRNWGIYVHVPRLSALALLMHKTTSISFADSLHYCCYAVLQHEYFHFLTEYVATMVETIVGREIYLRYRENTRYPYGYNPPEEAAANALEITTLKTREEWTKPPASEVIGFMERVCRMSPIGYRDYPMFLDKNGLLDAHEVREFWSREFNNYHRRLGPLLPLRHWLLSVPTPYEMPGRYLLKAIPKYVYPSLGFPLARVCPFKS
ncbi:MAG: hypothetical protein QXO22_05460 [Thermosphaera sp.]